MMWHRWQKDQVESKLGNEESGGEATPSAAPAKTPNTRIRKGRSKKMSAADRPKRPSLRVVPRHEERPGNIPYHLAWYYRKDTRPAGPFTLEEMVELLELEKISAQTLVWSESIVEDWTPAAEITLLNEMLQ
jgi:hypothetical protein